MRTRGRTPVGNDTPAVPKPPLVVTIDSDGDLVDMVGDVEVFAGEGESADYLVQRLLDLLEGSGGYAEVLQAVELSPGRYADIHVVAEGDLRHFVLLDASDVMQALQRTQQLSHESALEREREQRVLRGASSAGDDRVGRQGAAFRLGAGLFSAIVADMRESLVLLSGHARILARHCAGDEVALRSVAAIQHAAVRLDALSSNGLIALGGLSAGGSRPGAVDLQQLAAFLHDAFALQAKGQGIGFEVHVPEARTLVELDDLALRQVLINLLAHALDGMTHGDLVLSLSLGARHMEVEISAEPQGFRAAHFGPLVTTSELLHSNTMGSLALAISQQILRRMDAELELVPRKEGGHLVWFRVPVRQTEGHGIVAPESVRSTVAVAVRPSQLQDTVVAMLADMGAATVFAATMGDAEALVRTGTADACVLSLGLVPEGAALLNRRGAMEGIPMLLFEGEFDPLNESGWVWDGHCIRLAPGCDSRTLRDALTAMLSGLPRKRG